ncbi:MAG: thioredoxin domain-containing protein [Gemmataceae bacterium]|nr:thioredoxin domain-containing protein [Gemmataceae bacterium]MDW8267479.1 thioredoxin domain-containing protein [Gemmataceae bacterium]
MSPHPGFVLLVLGPWLAAEPPKDQPRPTNRLAQESSPYLRQHAHNPVDWFPWGPEAFAKAKKENKLVFLSIGYSSCYWCHVMERESFANGEVAKLLNQWFVCIKVDREERPDIDAVYMMALHVLGQRGGWPMSMFLTPDGKPIIGGTYWPREDRMIEGETVRGFKSILKIVHEFWTDRPKELLEQADRLAAATREALARERPAAVPVPLDRRLVQAAVEAVQEEFDPVYGGFGSRERGFRGTKFPLPPYLNLILAEVRRSKSPALTKILTVTLDHMAAGGIYDQLGGGFHRYSTERTWTVPHFEKMLYDNAQLVEVYAQAAQLTQRPSYRRVVRETLDFVRREMTAPDGGFYSALDAETEAHEGRFYVWTAKELDEALGADAARFRQAYGAAGPANFEGKYHILVLAPTGAEGDDWAEREKRHAELAPLRRRLLALRMQRPRPFLDTKILTAWNGQMIAGYAVAGQALGEPGYVEAAARAADFILSRMKTKDGRLRRTYAARPGQQAEARLNGYLDDYAFLVHGLLALHDATGQDRWLTEARALTDTMIRLFADDKQGGFFYTSHDHEQLFARSKDQHDGAQPSANSLAARNLVRLAVKTGDASYRRQAEKTFQAFAATLRDHPSSLPALAEALGLYLDTAPRP